MTWKIHRKLWQDKTALPSAEKTEKFPQRDIRFKCLGRKIRDEFRLQEFIPKMLLNSHGV